MAELALLGVAVDLDVEVAFDLETQMLGRSRGGGRAANRAADPEFAAWLDGMRSRFGATLTRVEWPDGRTWGPEPAPTRTMNADEWLDYVNDPNPRPLGAEWQR